MIDWAFHWLTPTERPCISFWAGISSDTKILCLPPKSCVLLPFQCYFWMIFSFMLLYLLQLNSYTLLLDLLRFSPAWLRPEGQQHQTSPAGTQLLSTPLTLCLLPRHGEGITCFVSPAPNDLCRLIKPSLSWDQGCLMSDHSMGRAPMATFIHRAFHKKRQIQAPCGHCADRYNPALPCSPYTQSWKLPKQVFISGNATRMLGCLFSPTIKRGFSSRNHKNFLGNSLRPISILLQSSWNGEGTKMGDGKISAYKISSLLLLTQKFEKNDKKQQTA